MSQKLTEEIINSMSEGERNKLHRELIEKFMYSSDLESERFKIDRELLEECEEACGFIFSEIGGAECIAQIFLVLRGNVASGITLESAVSAMINKYHLDRIERDDNEVIAAYRALNMQIRRVFRRACQRKRRKHVCVLRSVKSISEQLYALYTNVYIRYLLISFDEYRIMVYGNGGSGSSSGAGVSAVVEIEDEDDDDDPKPK